MIALRLAAAASLVLLAAAPAAAADPTGTWTTEGGKSRVRIAACGSGQLCGTIVGLAEPNDPATGKPKTDKNNADPGKRARPLVGTQTVLGMKPNGADRWAGQVYNPEDGKTYSGNLTYAGGSSLRLEGCALGGMICKGQTWTKAN